MSKTSLTEIFELLKLKEKLELEEKKFIEKYFKKIIVDYKLREKILLVCEAVRNKFKTNLEWIGYLLGDENYIIKDFYIPYQIVSKAYVTEDPNYAGQNLVEIEDLLNKTGLKLVGWIHSHGDMDVFHSGIDNANTYSLVRFIGMYSKKEILRLDESPRRIKRVYCDGNSIVVEGDKTLIRLDINVPKELIRVLLNRRILSINRDSEKIASSIIALLLNYTKWTFLKKIWIAPVYSIVTNAKLDFYGEIWRFDSEKTPERVAQGDIIEFVRTPASITIDEEEIRSEVKRKIRRKRVI